MKNLEHARMVSQRLLFNQLPELGDNCDKNFADSMISRSSLQSVNCLNKENKKSKLPEDYLFEHIAKSESLDTPEPLHPYLFKQEIDETDF